jgi:hypothetical protein
MCGPDQLLVVLEVMERHFDFGDFDLSDSTRQFIHHGPFDGDVQHRAQAGQDVVGRLRCPIGERGLELLDVFAGIAFEEYSSEKGRSAAAYEGRCDLYLEFGDREYVAEAKQVWPSAGTQSTKLAKHVKQGLKRACKDAASNRRTREMPIGIVFVVPRIPPSDRDHMPECLEAFAAAIREVPADGHGWTFPRISRELEGADGYLYPGIAQLMRVVDRSGG